MKKGNRVELVENYYSYQKGDKGSIDFVEGNHVHLRMDTGEQIWLYKHRLKLIEMKPEQEVKFTVEEIRRAAETCPDFKRIMKTLKPEVFEEEVKYDKFKCYAIISGVNIFKLVEVKNEFQFISIGDTFHAYDIVYISAERAIKEAQKYNTVHTFTSQEEFVRWAAQQLNIL